MTTIEIIATFFGLACVLLTIKENIWCWPAGLVQVSLYIFVFYNAKLYSDMLLHIVYIFMQFYGWYFWLYGGKSRNDAEITSLGKVFYTWLILIVVGTFFLGYGMQRYTDASLPYPDAFTTVASLAAQWLLGKKKLESWILWISVDIIAIGVYAKKELYYTTILYSLFFILAILGFLRWKQEYREADNTL